MIWHPDMPPEYRNQIVTGDARELAKAIPDESIDLIFTDPMYDRMDDYRWLAETAARVLRPDRACLVFAGVQFLPEIHDALRAGGLSYRWRIIWRVLFGAGGGSWRGRLETGTQECLVYQKGKAKMHAALFDHNQIVRTEHGLSMRTNGNKQVWGKPEGMGLNPIKAFTQPEDIVLDCYTGYGMIPAVCKMLGRNYVAFEIEPETAERARQRVQNTQPPLFVLQPEQAEMAL